MGRGGRLLAVLAVAAATMAVAAATARAERFDCRLNAFVVNFVPARPLVEVRNADDKLVFAASATKYASDCTEVDDGATKWGGGPARRAWRAVSLTCIFPVIVELRIVPLLDARGKPAGGQLVVTLGHAPETVLSAALKRRGSSLAYDARYCAARRRSPQSVPGSGTK